MNEIRKQFKHVKYDARFHQYYDYFVLRIAEKFSRIMIGKTRDLICDRENNWAVIKKKKKNEIQVPMIESNYECDSKFER